MSIIITDFPPITSYELCDPTGVKESDFEDVVIRVLSHLYTDCIAIPFRPRVAFNDAIWKPDIALIDRLHRYWFVVEVEITTHHLEKHVIPQVSAFTQGSYGQDSVKLLAKGLQLTESEATTFLNYVPRQVVVVSNRLDNAWTKKLAAIDVQHLIISTYRNKITSQIVHHTYGELIPVAQSLAFGRVRATDGAIITKISDFWKPGEFEAKDDYGAGTWTCVIGNNQVWLMKKKGIIGYPDNHIVQIIHMSDGKLLFRSPYTI